MEVYGCLNEKGIVSGYKDFASQISVSTSMITEISKGRSNVGATALQNIVCVFSINGDWLLTGKGEMFLNGETEPNSIKEPLVPYNKSKITSEDVLYKIISNQEKKIQELNRIIGKLECQIETLREKN